MPLPSSISDLSQTAGSNSPAGSESPSLIDDYLRVYASYIALLRDQKSALNAATQTIASATTTDIGAATTAEVEISGTTTITGLGTIAAGARRSVRFLGALTLTHNATSLILPGAANITTAANDTAEFRSLGAGNWICLRYSLASGNYGRTNVLGTVAQSAGVPTGALMESGSNANGSYWRFANGLQICIGSLASGGTATTQGSIFISSVATGSFPIAFAAAPTVVASGLYNASGLGWATQATFSSATTWGNWAVYLGTTSGSLSTITLIAVGRWF
jgi:hypothetical protein